MRLSTIPIPLLLLLSATNLAAATPDASTYEHTVVRVVTASPSADGPVLASGSGFFVNDRHVVTNRHVVAGTRSSSNRPALFIILSGSDEPLPVTSIWSDEGLDLALLDYAGGGPHGGRHLPGGRVCGPLTGENVGPRQSGGIRATEGITWFNIRFDTLPYGLQAIRVQSDWLGTGLTRDIVGSIRVSQRHFGAFRGFSWVI